MKADTSVLADSVDGRIHHRHRHRHRQFIWKHKEDKKTVVTCEQYNKCVPRVRKAEMAVTAALKN